MTLDLSGIDFSSLNPAQRSTLAALGIVEGGPTTITLDPLSLTQQQINVLAGSGAALVDEVSYADTSVVEQYDINWGTWDNPVEQNWVAVQQIDEELVRISTDKFFAEVNAANIANMTGSYNYRTGIASSFIGTGSAGDISSLVASMAVNFDTGIISDGSLQVMAGEQAWAVTFDGLIDNGLVELNPVTGQLMDPTGVISNQIDASLGGAFTGGQAEAFVGGFELLDAMNELNNVEGIFTIER